MSSRPTALTEELHRYLLEVSLREPPLLAELRAETAQRADSGMQIAPEQGQFMAFMVELTGAGQILEIGTFTGYSALAMALALPPEGRIVACDVNPDTTAVGRRYWARAGVAEKIDLRLAPALETLEALRAEGAAGRFDLAFIDADKENYEAYFEAVLPLLRTGGLLMIDNVLWGGRAADPTAADSDTRAIRALNARLKKDARISLSLLPLSDGLTLVRKR